MGVVRVGSSMAMGGVHDSRNCREGTGMVGGEGAGRVGHAARVWVGRMAAGSAVRAWEGQGLWQRCESVGGGVQQRGPRRGCRWGTQQWGPC